MYPDKKEHQSILHVPAPFAQTFFHGTKADLKIGDLIQVGFTSNYEDRKLRHVYVASTLNAAVLGAELASGNGRERIYLVEATSDIEDDPNVTDKKFPGNPTGLSTGIHGLATALSGPEPIAFPTWVLLDKDYQVLFCYNGVLTAVQLNELMKTIDEINK